MNPVEALLRREIGLDSASIGSSIIERIVRLRMTGRGVNTFADYERFLESSPQEWEELVEAVVVTETWFFRDRETFNALGRLARQQGLGRQATGVLRVLSVPCSSGEEPYSLAMTLLDAGLSPQRFVIDAVDISARALARAKAGIYGKNSFRGDDLAFRDRYFESAPGGFQLRARVRDCVTFHRDNLLSEDFAVGDGPYNYILCRNLLIYFDAATQRGTLEKLHRKLAPDGILFVGPAELPLVTESGFESAGIPMAFACHKSSKGAAGCHAGHAVRASELAPQSTLPAPLSRPGQPMNGNGQSASSAQAPGPARDISSPRLDGLELARARKLADAGMLREAAAICEAFVRDQGPCAQAFYLLGLVRDANGDPQAAEFYRKALYLEPDHYESLVQLSLLLEKNGDAEGAQTLKQRAQRVEQKA